MNCKTFHRNLEDYLEGGLDFSGRFGMERHAQQCIGCGKEMLDAQRLHGMVSDLQRVKAPANFEASVLREIGNRKSYSRFSVFRSFWTYGFEWPSFRKLALTFSGLAILFFGIFYASNRANFINGANPSQVVSKPAVIPIEAKATRNIPGTSTEMPVRNKPSATETPKLAKRVRPAAIPKSEPVINQDVQDTQGLRDMDYVEYAMPGPDNRSVPVRLPLPKVIPVRYGQMSEEYFIQNVSH